MTDAMQINPTSPRVTAVHKERYELVYRGEPLFAKLKTGVYYEGDEPYPTVGDFVEIQHNPFGDSLITKTLPRRSFFSRLDPYKALPQEQAVAANFDYVFITSSCNQDFNPSRLERYLTLAWQSGGTPVIILTKADLTDDGQARCRAAEAIAPGVAVIAVSAVTGQGLGELEPYLRPGKTIVFLGSSGVGKSSLVNVLAGGARMEVSTIRAGDDKGRHTTTHRQLIALPSGVMVIDTPGMRELGLWEVSSGLGEAFSDVESLLGGCKYSDCTHQSEPGCAILAAIADGQLTQTRLDHYEKLKREALYIENKVAHMQSQQSRMRQYQKDIKLRRKLGEKPKK